MALQIAPGQTLGLVGGSGSGKSTVGKAVLGLVDFSGEVVVYGTAIAGLSRREMKPVRRRAQMIFQDPYASLDPRMAVDTAIAEPLAIHGIGKARGPARAGRGAAPPRPPQPRPRDPHGFSASAFASRSRPNRS